MNIREDVSKMAEVEKKKVNIELEVDTNVVDSSKIDTRLL